DLFAPPEAAMTGASLAEAPLPGVADNKAIEEEPVEAAPSPAVARPEPRQSTLGEIDVDRAAETLIASGAARAILVSPEGDEAAASAVLVAREVSDAGLRVLLLDLTASGAASRPMLDSSLFP